MTCEYHFTIENYFVLSKACHLCPFNKTDCFRPHCVSTNGHMRTIIAVNRQMPGPSIEVCKGDTVLVWVENKMEDGSSTSVHWHGQTQMNSCHMDGTAMLTQCSIPPYEMFRYEFTADPAGTHWYHSHTGLQVGEGLIGAFIVREPKSHDPNSALYEEDLSDHVMIINDWLDVTQLYRYLEEMHDLWEVTMPINALVNGRGEKHGVMDEHNLTGSAIAPDPTYTPLEVFNVDFGKTYRFRMISAAPRCFFKVSVDNHELVAIATDGAPLKPVTVQSIMIHPGERFDFVLNANQAPGNYWIKLQGLWDCKPSNGNGYAILHYNGYQGDERPSGDPTDFSTQNGIVLNPLQSDPYGPTDILQKDLRYGGSNENYEDEQVDVQYYISLLYLPNDNTRYNHPDLYSVHRLPNQKSHITPTLNNITLSRPPVPLVTQWDDAKGVHFCNMSNTDTVNDCNDNLCYCTHMLEIKLGQVVELFMVGYSNDPHAMHLHGQRFRVVGDGMLGPGYNNSSIPDIMEKDKAGEFPRILRNPMHKDTLAVNGRGGYSIIRFKATNPGIWFFHCHNEGHLMQGMALLIKVGSPEEFPKPPSYFPKCGGYTYQPKEKECQVSHASKPHILASFLISVAITILLL